MTIKILGSELSSLEDYILQNEVVPIIEDSYKCMVTLQQLVGKN
ncbi:hypothetical protein [Jeotgalibacillus campisalis]|uniref:Uncharacterized protein n=1 Tax=Jeotgalibacillus campisalis TaxID=220754 RepID=A0A0C2VGL7_9BACL|nr:hypothetical protein [Jeotgalibacillus campisalis]KIL43148.1 hypothetical protein KR50_35510 [Jeotgalibacillus campisalis]